MVTLTQRDHVQKVKMLSETEIKEIEGIASRYDRGEAASIEALKVVQEHRGWVSDESLQEVAGLLRMTADELDSVATFYNLILRKPVGKHVIYLCDSISCYAMGEENILDYFKHRLGIRPGETTADGLFTLVPVSCLGTCDRAPALMIDKDMYQDVRVEILEKILEKYR